MVRFRSILTFGAVLGLVAVGCVPPPDRSSDAVAIRVRPGTVELVVQPLVGATAIVSAVATAPQDGVTLTARPLEPIEGSGWRIALRAVASLSSPSGSHSFRVSGIYCGVELWNGVCPDWEQGRYSFDVSVTVTDDLESPVDALSTPDPSRWVSSTEPGVLTLPDQLTLIAEDAVEPAEVGAAIVQTGGQQVGAFPELRLHQAMYESPDQAEMALSALKATGLFASVAFTSSSTPSIAARPSDWGPGTSLSATWGYEATGADLAWATNIGDRSVAVGVVDVGIWRHHPELSGNLVEKVSLYPDVRGALEAAAILNGSGRVNAHGTHVASILCARDGNGGTVGVMQSCALHGLDFAVPAGQAPLGDDDFVKAISIWIKENHLRVVNMSWVYGPSESKGCVGSIEEGLTAGFRALFKQFGHVLFTVAAGNCPGVSTASTLPPLLGEEMANVITVSATGYHAPGEAAPLASYSAPDGELAAPGGGSGVEVRGAVYQKNCGGIFWTCTFPSTGYADKSGTSQAAPLVAGAAGLALSANPHLTIDELVGCVRYYGAVTPVVATGSHQPRVGLREIRIDETVNCARALQLGNIDLEEILTALVGMWAAGDNSLGGHAAPGATIEPAEPGLVYRLSFLDDVCFMGSSGAGGCFITADPQNGEWGAYYFIGYRGQADGSVVIDELTWQGDTL